jgi:siroheme synthase
MGMARVGEIADALRAGGRPGATPAAVVQDGGTARMRSHVTTLDRLAGDVARLGLGSPAVIVVGDVVALAAAAAGADGVIATAAAALSG